ncbi:MipA/OmpV family protein [Alteromonas halophila]|uniref:MipA/OmpV family protein n=1 Tax=Alteromonas halophila TaxID=516698 RepID=A0A918JH62_9ALTE|nr:MipA/OmpV family protein [Alteromonas halophila]GGW75826.1 hypothetical protein GCM10007391_05270 [Alteromonas halophila]
MQTLLCPFRALRIAACLLGLSLSFSAISEQVKDSPNRDLTGFESQQELQPLWEAGVGGGVIEVPNYPASVERNLVALALPYVVYRGDIFRVGDGGGARAVVIEESDYEFDISLGGAFSANNEEGGVRDGMPDLDYLFEVGPQLIYRVRDFRFDGGGSGRLNARLQTRAVFSTDFSGIDHQGYVLEPMLSYQQRGRLFKDTGLNVSLSLVFATEELHDYFYQVDPAFVTAQRPAYDAKSGYLGAELSMGVSFPIRKRLRGFFGGSVQFNQGAANRDSPLFEDDITYSIGLGFVWRLYESEQRASW